MNELMRELAPITAAAWGEIEEEAKRTLTTYLAARKLVDFSGPHGWEHSAVSLGRSENVGVGREGVEARLRQVQPLTELRVPFTLKRAELDAIARGAEDADLDPVVEAAKKIALAEDAAVFHGAEAAGIEGIAQAADARKVALSDDYLQYAISVAEATHQLRAAGIGGPYALALGPRCHEGVHKTFTAAGFPVLEQVRRLVDGPIVWAPAIDGAVVLSLRGGDFELTVGQDLSIGYLRHDAETVTLYLQESFTFRCLDPEAAVPLRYG